MKETSLRPATPGNSQSAYGFDIETERRREAGFLEEIRRRRWTVRAYDAQGNTVETCHAGELSAAVEIAKELEEEYPKVDIITAQGSVFPRCEWRAGQSDGYNPDEDQGTKNALAAIEQLLREKPWLKEK